MTSPGRAREARPTPWSGPRASPAHDLGPGHRAGSAGQGGPGAQGVRPGHRFYVQGWGPAGGRFSCRPVTGRCGLSSGKTGRPAGRRGTAKALSRERSRPGEASQHAEAAGIAPKRHLSPALQAPPSRPRPRPRPPGVSWAEPDCQASADGASIDERLVAACVGVQGPQSHGPWPGSFPPELWGRESGVQASLGRSLQGRAGESAPEPLSAPHPRPARSRSCWRPRRSWACAWAWGRIARPCFVLTWRPPRVVSASRFPFCKGPGIGR